MSMGQVSMRVPRFLAVECSNRMDASIYTDIVTSAAGAILPQRLKNTDAGFHTQIVVGRDGGIVQPSVANMMGSGVTTPGSFKGSNGTSFASQLYTTYLINQAERRYYIARETADLSQVTMYAPVNVAVTRSAETGEYVLTFDEPQGEEANPVDTTMYVVYYVSSGTGQQQERTGQIVYPGGSNILQVGGKGGLQGSQVVFVRAEYIPLPSRVSEFSAVGVPVVFKPLAPMLSAAVGPGEGQVTLTLTAAASAPADVSLNRLVIQYEKAGGESGVINNHVIDLTGPGVTTTTIITLPAVNVAFSIRVKGSGPWGGETDWSAVIGGLVPRVPPTLSGLTLTLVTGGVQLGVGSVTANSGNLLLLSNNILVRFIGPGGSVAASVYQTISGVSGSFVLLTADIAGLSLGVQYTLNVQALGQNLNGEVMTAGQVKFGLPRDVANMAVAAVQPSGTLRITWDAATSYGGAEAPITGYVLSYSGGSVNITGGATTQYDLGVLTPQVSYTLYLRAITAYGQSVNAASASGIPLQYSRPPVPSGEGVVLYRLASTFGARLPVIESTQSVPVNGYRLYVRSGSGSDTLIGEAAQPVDSIVTTLFLRLKTAAIAGDPAASEQYAVDVAAAGAAGDDRVVPVSTTFTLGTTYTLSYAPYNSTAESTTRVTIGTGIAIGAPARTFSGVVVLASPGGAGTYKVQWVNGGSASTERPVDVLRYYVNGVRASGTLSGAGSPTAWTGLGLVAGNSVQIVAQNDVGEGEKSAGAVVPAWVAEGAVTGVQGAIGYESLYVTWVAKATTWGLATTSYRVVVGAAEQIVSAGGSPAASFAVVNGQTYNVSVYARNVLGEESVAGVAGPYTISDSGPILGAITAASHSVTLNWSAKSLTWGALTTGYKIYKSVNGGADTLVESVGSATLTRTISGLANLTSTTFRITAVNGTGNESSRSAWGAVTLAARLPTLAWGTDFAGAAAPGLVSGSVRVFKPTETAGTNLDGLTGEDIYEVDSSANGVSTLRVVSFGGAGWVDLPTGTLTNGVAYRVRVRRKYSDVAPWSADIYYTDWTASVVVTPFAPVGATLSGAHVTGTALAAGLQWSVAGAGGVAAYFPGGYYFAVRIVPAAGGAATYYSYRYDAATINKNYTIITSAAGSHTFSLAITAFDISGENIPGGVWATTPAVTFIVYDVPEAPLLTNALVFDAAGGATDTFSVVMPNVPTPDGRPVSEYKLYDTAGNILVGSGASSGGVVTFPYTYALSVLGGVKQFEAVAINTEVGRSAGRYLSVSIAGSPPYMAKDASAVSVTGQTITASGATATLGWTKNEPNATYFPVTGFRVDVSAGGSWVALGSYAASATGSGAIDVSGYVVNGAALTFRVVQLGSGVGRDASGIVVSSAVYSAPAIGAASIGVLSAVDKVISVPWTYSGAVANITGLMLDISGAVQAQVSLAAAASGAYTYNAISPGVYSFSIRGVNAFAIGASSTYASITITEFIAPYTYKSIACGNAHTAALISDGTMRTWGNNASGQLGIDSTTTTTIPATPCNISGAIAIACGNSYTAALIADGTMRTWGNNASGQLGDDSTTTTTIPVTPCNMNDVVAIACGNGHTAALIADGTMRTWGANLYGQLGISNIVPATKAVTPCNISNAVAIACGTSHTAVLIADGTMRIWGINGSGQLGSSIAIGSFATAAVTPCNISNAVAIACGASHTAVLIADGTMRTWGAGTNGQLGITTSTDMSRAVTTSNISNAVAISCGSNHTAALLADGTMRTWGAGTNGQLGNLANIDSGIPVTPCNIASAIAIACGGSNTSALIADGTMRTWGSGLNGQLGNQDIVRSNIPVTPCNIASVAIVNPSFAISTILTNINVDISAQFFMRIPTRYQPGTIPYRGIALVGRTGTWQYSTNSGGSWTTLSAVTASSAVAVRLDPAVRIRCTAAGVLSVKAWSAQQAVPAVVTTGVDTTIATATIQGYSFAAATTSITAT